MIDYNSIEHEWLAIQWFHTMARTRDRGGKGREPSGLTDLQMVLPPKLHEVTEFLNFFKYKAGLALEIDNSGIWFACWTIEFGEAFEFGCWCRPDKRGTLALYRHLAQAYDEAFLDQPRTLYGITIRKELHEQHLRLGYVYCGQLPGLFAGRTAFIYAMNKTTRQNAIVAQKRRIKDLAFGLQHAAEEYIQ